MQPRLKSTRLGEQFLGDLHDVWQRKGKCALEIMVEEHPVTFVAIAAGLLPRAIELSLSDKELGALSDLIEALIAGRPGSASDVEPAAESVTAH
jgi:hypothetical protein